MTRPALRYSLFYFFSVSLYSFVLAFYPLHCKEQGFTPFQIAAISAAATLATIIGSPLFLQLAHVRISPRRLLLCGSALSLVIFSSLFYLQSFYPVLILWFLCATLKRGGDSVVDSQAVRDSAEGGIYFERVRTWGSIGFIIATFIIGALTDFWGSGSIIPSGFIILLSVLACAYFVGPVLSPVPTKERAVSPSEIVEGYRKPLLALLIAVFLSYISHSVLYVYLSIYLDTLGWSGKMISLAWNIGVVAEITVFLAVTKLERLLSLNRLFQLSIFLTVVRWLIFVSTTNTGLILFAQVLHGFTFGGCYIASMKLVHRILPEHLKDRGQGLLAAVGTGAGSLLGRFLVGAGAEMIASYRDIDQLFLAAAVIALPAFYFSLKLGGHDTA